MLFFLPYCRMLRLIFSMQQKWIANGVNQAAKDQKKKKVYMTCVLHSKSCEQLSLMSKSKFNNIKMHHNHRGATPNISLFNQSVKKWKEGSNKVKLLHTFRTKMCFYIKQCCIQSKQKMGCIQPINRNIDLSQVGQAAFDFIQY